MVVNKVEKLYQEKNKLISIIDELSKNVLDEDNERKQEKLMKMISQRINQLRNNLIKMKSYGEPDVNEQMVIDKKNMLRNL